jgi:hypothetical protein
MRRGSDDARAIDADACGADPTTLATSGERSRVRATVDGQWTYAGYRMTGSPRYTERALELFGAIDGHVPFDLDEALTQAGAA